MPIPSASASNSAHRALQLLSIVTTALAVVSCNNDLPVTPVTVASTADALSAYRAAAFTLDVSIRDGGVTVSQPLGDARSTAMAPLGFAEGATAQRSLSLLGAGAVDIVPSNLSAGAIGAVVPGRILITFDLTIVNRLGGILSGR